MAIIVGPLLMRSRIGNHFVLAIYDATTQYPEAIPIHSCDTEHAAEALINFFTRACVWTH